MSDYTEEEVMKGYTDENGVPIDPKVQMREDAEAAEEAKYNSMIETSEPTPSPVMTPEAQENPELDAFLNEAEAVSTPGASPSNAQVAATPAQEAQEPGLTYEQAKTSEATFGTTPVLSAAHAASFGLTTKLASELAGSKLGQMVLNSNMTDDEWYDIFQRRMQGMQQEYPYLSQISDMAGGGSGAAAAPGLLQKGFAASSTAAKGLSGMAAGAAGGYAAPAPGADTADRIDMALFGATLGGAFGTVAGKMTSTRNIADPETLRTINAIEANKRQVGPLGGVKGWYLKKEKEMASAESGAAYESLEANPHKYNDILDTDEARTEIIQDTLGAVNQMKSVGDAKNAEIERLGQQFQKHIKVLAKLSRDRQEPTDKIASSFKDMLANAKQYKIAKVESGWDYLPKRDDYIESPETAGFPLKYIIDSHDEGLHKDKFLTGVDANTKRAVNAEIENDRATLIQEAVRNGVLSAIEAEKMDQNAAVAAGRFILANPKILTDAKTRKKLLVNNKDFDMTSVSDLLRYVDNVEPIYVRDKLSDMFTGYRVERGASEATRSDIRTSVAGEAAYSKIHGKLRKDLAKHYNNKQFNDITSEANQFETSVILPLKAQIESIDINRPQTVRDMQAAFARRDSQSYNSLMRASELGLVPPDLLKTVKDMQNLEGIFNSGSIEGMTTQEAVEMFAKRREGATRLLALVSMTDPSIAGVFGQAVKTARNIVEKQNQYDSLIKGVKGRFDEVYKLIPKNKLKTADFARNLVTSVAGPYRKDFNASQVDSNALQAITGINEYNYRNSTDPAGRVADAIDKMRRVREVDLLNQAPRNDASVNKGAARSMTRFVGMAVAPRMTYFLDMLVNLSAKSAKDFTNGKWTRLQPYLIETALKQRIDERDAMRKAAILPTDLINSNLPKGLIMQIVPGSPEALEAISIIRGDKALSPREKVDAIKKINEEGIEIKEGDK